MRWRAGAGASLLIGSSPCVVAACTAAASESIREQLRTPAGVRGEGGVGGMALAWFSQVIIAAERLTRAMRYALARRATCPGAKLSRACSRM